MFARTRSIVIIALTALIFNSATTLAQVSPLTADEVRTLLIGKVLEGRRGRMKVRLTFNPDGSVLARAIVGKARGTWVLHEDGQVCVTMKNGPERGERCRRKQDCYNAEVVEGLAPCVAVAQQVALHRHLAQLA